MYLYNYNLKLLKSQDKMGGKMPCTRGTGLEKRRERRRMMFLKDDANTNSEISGVGPTIKPISLILAVPSRGDERDSDDVTYIINQNPLASNKGVWITQKG
jgi:hypothetical protein